ncbi:formate/nitrite transporter family protein [Clostridium weizhouense]|uniref:Formate/nitrite transporter family protein n=1 Tax=Clostridium weizhouense TaxID=2859781 RepID=A0ABS7ASJ5_9CLOT|nr:formate/nitrite transporter family protein [Clostridium weizhouense]MBW6410460.1 formate/nitrite transporter family protein [Clostridium weizhouense]
MYTSDMDIISNSAKNKYNLSKANTIKYLIRAVVAGFYLVVAIILSYTTGAVLINNHPEVSKIMVAATFSIALALIVFLGGELFTGNNLIMGMGFYTQKCTFKMVLRVWGLSYLGNFIGAIILSFIFVKSGASMNLIKEYVANIVEIKLHLPIMDMFLRGILCNFIVCLGVLSTIRLKSESGKLIMMFWCVFAFVIAGFEHSIANMGIFSVGYFSSGGLPLTLIAKNLFWVTFGNIIGGAVLLALPLKIMSVKE